MLRCFHQKTPNKERILNMRTKELCHKLLSNTSIHKKRVKVISEVIETILIAKEISVTKVGRKMKNKCQTRSNIRKVDRLYSNKHLLQETNIINREIAKFLIKTDQPLVAIDGSKIPNSRWYILSASLVVEGRSTTLCEVIFERRYYGSPKLYKKLLLELKSIFPDNTAPILITDAEFKRPWFEMVDTFGWDYIVRVRGNKFISVKDEDFQSMYDFFDQATHKPKSFGYGFLNIQQEYLGYFYLYKEKPKRRHAHTRSGR